MKDKTINPAFSALVIRCLQHAGRDHKRMAPQEIARTLGKEVDEVLRIQKGESAFAVEEVLKLGEACGRPISLLIQKEFEKKNVPSELKKAFKSLHNLLKTRARIEKSMAPEVPPAVRIEAVEKLRKKRRALETVVGTQPEHS